MARHVSYYRYGMFLRTRNVIFVQNSNHNSVVCNMIQEDSQKEICNDEFLCLIRMSRKDKFAENNDCGYFHLHNSYTFTLAQLSYRQDIICETLCKSLATCRWFTKGGCMEGRWVWRINLCGERRKGSSSYILSP